MEQEYKKKIEEPKFFDKKHHKTLEPINYEIIDIPNFYNNDNKIIGKVYDDNTIFLNIHDKKVILFYEDNNGKILDNTDKIAILN